MIETEVLLNAVFSTSKIGMCVLDYKNYFLNVNKTYCKIYGYSREELVGQHVSMIEPEGYKDRASLYYKNFILGNQENDGLKQIKVKDGTWKKVFISSEKFFATGEQEYKLTSVIEIEERDQVVFQKVNDQNSAISLAHHIPEGLFRVNKKGEILYANQFFLDLFGYSSRHDAFSFYTNLFYNKMARDYNLLEELESRSQFSDKEILLKKKDGSTFWALVTCSQSVDDYTNVYYNGSIKDFTEKREAMVRLEKQNSELVKINGELDRFVYCASHDLKAPLSSLSGLVNILKNEKSEEQRDKYLQLMEKSIHKMDSFIMDIVDYSRNSTQKVKREEVDFEAIIKEIFQELEYMEHADKIKKIINVNQPVPFYSDVRRIKAILSNLISNSIRYSSTHRKDDCFIYVAAFVNHDTADLIVKDNGQGIAEKHLDKIFNMFFRASEGGTGSGLGLYIVKETVEKLDGTIQVVSELGKGTSFSIAFSSVREGTSDQQMKLNI